MKAAIFKTIVIILICVPVSHSASVLHENKYQSNATTPLSNYNIIKSNNNTIQQPFPPGLEEAPQIPQPEQEFNHQTPQLSEPGTQNQDLTKPKQNTQNQTEKDEELINLLNDTKILLLEIKNHEINDIVLVDGYFRDGNLLITKIPVDIRSGYKSALIALATIFHNTPNIMETIEEDSFNEDNEFLTAYNNLDYYLGECIFL